MKEGKTLFLGIDNAGDLVSLELNFNDLNKGTKFYNSHYYITPHGYTDIKDDYTGEKEAREVLNNSEYWEDLGYLNKNTPAVLSNHIDYDAVADEVLNSDGWQNTNGEYYEIGFYKDKTYFINLNWIGRDNKKLFKKKDYKKVYVSDEDFKFLANVRGIKEKDEKKVREIKTIFSKYQDKNQIIKDMLEEHK